MAQVLLLLSVPVSCRLYKISFSAFYEVPYLLELNIIVTLLFDLCVITKRQLLLMLLVEP